MEQLLQYFIPETYNLDLTINRSTETIIGTVEIIGTPQSDIIKLNAVDLKIKNLQSQKVTKTPENLIYKNLSDFSECNFTQKDGILEIKNFYQAQNDQKTTQNDLIKLKINFETNLNNNLQGCYLSSFDFNNKKEKIVATQFESHYARECFPCIDEPAAKAQFILHITVPDLESGDIVLANTELTQQEGDTFTFAPTPRMSTYLLAWVIGKFQKVETVNKNGVKVASYAALNQTLTSLEFANEVAARALEYYDDKFGLKYPLNKLDQVALPDFEAGAMENWGLVTYRESCMLAEPNAAVDTKQSVAVTVTHELSHQWFGDLVTMEWWNDLWLNESFATIMEFYATDALYPEFKVWQDFYTSDCLAALRRDCLPGVQAVQQEVYHPAEIATLFDSAIVYAKGARLVLMLIKLMGETNFYKGVQDYFQKYQYQNTIGDNLWDCLQPYAQFDIKKFMHAWVSQPGYPALQYCENGDTKWWAQQRFLIDGTTDDTKWPLPEVRDDMSGHYILDLSDEAFHQKLSQFDTLSLEQKLRLLIDKSLLAKANLVPSSDLVELLPKFTAEDAPVWDILLSIINDLKIFFPYQSAQEQNYQSFLRNIISTRIREVGLVSQPDESSNEKRLRTILAVIARFAKDDEIIGELSAQYQSDLSQLDSEMRGNILMAKMFTSEAEVYPELFAKYQTESDPEIKDDLLGAIATAKLPEHISQNLSLLAQPEIVRPQDHLFFYIYLLRNESARSQALDWLYQNWDSVAKMAGEKSIEDYPRCTAGYLNTPEQAKQFYAFFDQHSDNPVLKRTLAMARVGIDARLHLISQQSVAVQVKVKSLLA